MMTKEEYQKTLVRMWDSVRTEYKGNSHYCAGVACKDCPIKPLCGEVINYYGTIELVEKWGKEHPVETNGSEFLKTYPTANVSGYKDNGKILFITLDNSKPSNADGNCIEVPVEWWEKEVE